MVSTTTRTLFLGDLCTHCGRDTSPSSGLWVDRIPSIADAEQASEWLGSTWKIYDTLDGWLCRECQNYDDWHDDDEVVTTLGTIRRITAEAFENGRRVGRREASNG